MFLDKTIGIKWQHDNRIFLSLYAGVMRLRARKIVDEMVG